VTTSTALLTAGLLLSLLAIGWLVARGRRVGARLTAALTEERHLRDQLLTGEALLRETLERSGVASWELMPETGELRTSANFAEIHGLGDAAPLVQWGDLLTLVHRDDREELERAVATARSGGLTVDAEVRFGGDDEARWIFERLSSTADGDGLVRVLGLGRDVTTRHGAAERERFLAEATDALSSTVGYAETLSALAELAVPALADWCRVAPSNDPVLASALGAPPAPVERGALPPQALAAIARLDTEAALESRRARVWSEIGDDDTASSAIAIPLVSHGQTAATVVFGRDGRGGAYDDSDLALGTELVRRAGVALDHARLLRVEEVARARAEASALRAQRLQTVVDATFSSANADEFLTQLLQRLREAIGADVATILVADEHAACLTLRSTVGVDSPKSPRVAFGEGFAGRIAATRTHETGTKINPTEFGIPTGRSTGVASATGVPLISEGALVGVLLVGSADERTFDDEDVMLLRLVASRAANSLDRAQAYERDQSIAEGDTRIAHEKGRSSRQVRHQSLRRY